VVLALGWWLVYQIGQGQQGTTRQPADTPA
jgi:hypothetical protein